ncbi:MAG TPA: AraC family transcriptional regulator [Pyrinomonadaceae bacterium]|nr:AraC family transcriptional regulator [Pyrinomonadaceae bacterium]
MTEPTIAAGNARALMELAVAKGASREVLAARSGLDPAELQDQDRRIPFAKYVALMRAGKELCRDPALALHYGEAVDFAEVSVVGLIGRASETMADGFAQFNRYARLVVDDGKGRDRFVLKRSAGQLWVVDTLQNADDFPEFAETSFARMVCTSRRWFPESQFIKAVHFTHAPPEYRAEYERVFRVPVVFESDRNALLTDDAWLTHRNPHASRYVFGILSAHAEELLERLERSKTTRGRVESLLMPIMHTGDADMLTIARKLGVSRQTLFRKLKAEGVTFEKVLDELRRTMALDYLRGRKVSVNETAYLVGFSDPAAFSRAFKRWTGHSPGAFASAKH